MRSGRVLGILLRALVLGTLLFVALVEILGATGADRLFRYQAF